MLSLSKWQQASRYERHSSAGNFFFALALSVAVTKSDELGLYMTQTPAASANDFLQHRKSK